MPRLPGWTEPSGNRRAWRTSAIHWRAGKGDSRSTTPNTIRKRCKPSWRKSWCRPGTRPRRRDKGGSAFRVSGLPQLVAHECLLVADVEFAVINGGVGPARAVFRGQLKDSLFHVALGGGVDEGHHAVL